MPQKQIQSELAPMPSDSLVPDANVVSDVITEIDAPIEKVYGLLAQMGRRDENNKRGGGGWPLPAGIEGRFIAEDRQGLREPDPSLALRPGDEFGDWLAFGEKIVATVVETEAPNTLVFTSKRGKTDLIWALALTEKEDGKTELHTRLRLNNIEHTKALSKAMVVDRLLIKGLKKGIEERHRGVVPEQKQKATKVKAAMLIGGLVATAFIANRRRKTNSSI